MRRYVLVKCPLENAPSSLRAGGYIFQGVDRDGYEVWATPRIVSERPYTLLSLLRERCVA